MIDLKGFPENQGVSIDEAKYNYISKREPYSLKQDFLNVQEISDACLYITSDAASVKYLYSFFFYCVFICFCCFYLVKMFKICINMCKIGYNWSWISL